MEKIVTRLIESSISKSRLGHTIGRGADGVVYTMPLEVDKVGKIFHDRIKLDDEIEVLKRIGGVDGIVKTYGYDFRNRIVIYEKLDITLNEFIWNNIHEFKKEVDNILEQLYNIIERVVSLLILPQDLHSGNIMIDRETKVVTIIDVTRWIEVPCTTWYGSVDSSIKFLYSLMSNSFIDYDKYLMWSKRYDDIIIPKLKEVQNGYTTKIRARTIAREGEFLNESN